MDSKENVKNILIIEQELIVSLELQRQLERHNYKVERASTFTSYFSTENKPDIIIADTSVKGGMYFQQIKNTWPGHTFPVISTDPNSTNLLVKEKELKVIAVFFKPFNTQAILDTVNNFFNAPLEQSSGSNR